MAEEKKKDNQLTRDDLKDIKGGIPYEKPELIELYVPIGQSGLEEQCGVGKSCSDGGVRCLDGDVCKVGNTPPTG